MMLSKITICTAAIFAIIAISVKSIATYAPHLLFKLPMGFIPWAMAGGQMPPYIASDAWSKEKRGWLKPKDVVVSVAAKSGTNWMLFCSHQIRVKGDDQKHPFEDVTLTTPWVDLIQDPRSFSLESRLEGLENTVLPDGKSIKEYWDHESYPFRIFKSHHTPEVYGDLIGEESDVKFLAMARNGLDTVASAVPFFDNHSDDFRRLWGGFPPAMSGSYREEAKIRLKEMMPGGMFEWFHFGYVNAWWSKRKEKNVLMIHYSDAKNDLSGTVSKLAEFYEVELTPAEHNTVVEKCGLPYMKANSHMFNYRLPFNPDFEGKTAMKDGTMIRRGTNGNGVETFTEEEQALFARAEEEMFGDDAAKLEWARNGGVL